MEAVYHYFKVQLPGYFKSLPLPKSFGGFATLTRSQWLQLLPFLIFVFIFFYLLVSPFLGVLFKGKKPRPHVNKKIKKNEKKVVHTFDIEDIGDKKAFCRCWKSSEVISVCWIITVKPHLAATSLIRPPHYSSHTIVKIYFMRSPHYKGHILV